MHMCYELTCIFRLHCSPEVATLHSKLIANGPPYLSFIAFIKNTMHVILSKCVCDVHDVGDLSKIFII
jgi:hypothetical protein